MNSALGKTVSILSGAGYQCLNQEFIKYPKGDMRPTLVLEWWAGSKGVVILQYRKDDHSERQGVQSFADWPLGHTFEELKEALK